MSIYEMTLAEYSECQKMLAEDDKRLTPPMCHMKPMMLDASDDEQWWQCEHCGHTKPIST